jgi:hypothetical protein
MNFPRNMIGPQVRKLRYERKLTQPLLAARCAQFGWNVSRETLAKIECQIRWVADFEIVCLARALRVEEMALYPKKRDAMLSKFFRELGD